MFSFLLPKHVKQGRQFVQDARKVLAYKRDLWSEATVADFETGIKKLEGACAEKDARLIEEAAVQLDQLCRAYIPQTKDAAWRENVEVFLVAIVIALAVRTYFLQPFTIPTGSMQPTLNGILAFPTEQAPPNPLLRIVDTAVFGRTWINELAKDDEVVTEIEEVKRFRFFTYTRVQTARVAFLDDGPRTTGQKGNEYLIHAPAGKLGEAFRVGIGNAYRRGDVIARGHIDTGDHVFVDKISYNFRPPQRGDVFVFNTQHLPTIERRRGSAEPNDASQFAYPELARVMDHKGQRAEMDRPSQFYIKRLTGLPGDELRIDSPSLFVNGREAEESTIRRVIAAQNGYGGDSNNMSGFLLPALQTPDETFTIPPKNYFAMGDNSYHSSDSRDWGPVPQENLMGRGVFVYWPFGKHWGLIR